MKSDEGHRIPGAGALGIALLAALPLAALDCGAACAGDLKVMSFNIRFSYPGFREERAENNWDDPNHPRRERALRVIRDYGPDLLGVQEARHAQVEDLQSALPEYGFYGIGRDDGKIKGEYSAIFYRKERFHRVDAGSFWLSATPEQPGTTFHTRPNAVPRIASWLKLDDRQSGRELVVLNMHWDHESEPARRKSAGLVRGRLATLVDDLPAIVMGDFNAPEDSSEVRELLGEQSAARRRLTDSYRKVHADRTPQEATFHGWQGGTEGARIDFILHSADFTPVAAEILHTAYDGYWPSDHFPVTATLRYRSSVADDEPANH